MLEEISDRVFLRVYINDTLTAASGQHALMRVVNTLSTEINLRELGEPKCILGMQVDHCKHEGQFTLHQHKYTDEIWHGELQAIENSNGGQTIEACS